MPARVVLDGAEIPLAGLGRRALPDVIAHLERLAACRNRVLLSIAVDGVPVWALHGRDGLDFRSVEAGTVGMEALGGELVRAARARAMRLEARAKACQFLFLINDRAAARRLWADLEPDFGRLVSDLAFLPELWSGAPLEAELAGGSVAAHLRRFGEVRNEVDLLLGRGGSSVQITDAWEGRLCPWLRQLGTFLERLDETRGE